MGDAVVDNAVLLGILGFAGVLLAALVATRHFDVERIERRRVQDKADCSSLIAEQGKHYGEMLAVRDQAIQRAELQIIHLQANDKEARTQRDADRDRMMELVAENAVLHRQLAETKVELAKTEAKLEILRLKFEAAEGRVRI